jgi:hypothetical protein
MLPRPLLMHPFRILALANATYHRSPSPFDHFKANDTTEPLIVAEELDGFGEANFEVYCAPGIFITVLSFFRSNGTVNGKKECTQGQILLG